MNDLPLFWRHSRLLAADPDTLAASAKAYVAALNKLTIKRKSQGAQAVA